MTEASCDIGLIGLAVMGQNFILNMNDHGFVVRRRSGSRFGCQWRRLVAVGPFAA